MARIPTKAAMFNKKAASPGSKPDEILNALDLKADQKVADIGSGGGYFTLRFAQAVGEKGVVYAVDVNNDFLGYIRSSAQDTGIKNIRTLKIDRDVDLPEKVDLIFMRNLYHHLKDRPAYFQKLKRFLKPDGKLVIIEHNPDAGGRFSFHKMFGHSTPKETIASELKAAGYELISDKELPEQNFMIFEIENQKKNETQ